VVPSSELQAAGVDLLAELRSLSPAVLRLTRRTLRKLHASDFSKRLAEVERIYLSQLMKSKDAREGICTFLEKRAPSWQSY
jgi:cyclohexa-1,5-dienecarbonyl-CoA hydratase